jgi:hypothetical protein
MQLSFWDPADFMDDDIEKSLTWLRQEKFDIRRRFYETGENYRQRILMSVYALSVDYKNPKWISLEYWVDICPRGRENRLPRNKSELPTHGCYYLRIRDVRPENWLMPVNLALEPAQNLPARATYRPANGDVLLSRFKEPLGKCVIYNGRPSPLYVSSNYLLLRPKSHVHPLLLLALLKSSFLACQLHYLIWQRTVVTEMFQYEAVQIGLPDLPPQLQEQVINYAEKRLIAEERYRIAEANKDFLRNTKERYLAIEVMNEVDTAVDNIIMEFCVEEEAGRGYRDLKTQ